MSYNTYDYGRMLADTRRISTYLDALAANITPESVVLDVGSGLGIFAITAAKLGAKKVIAIDPNPCVNNLHKLAQLNDCEIEVHCARAKDVNLDEKADIVVFDLRGALPLYQDSIDTLIDVRKRLAQPQVSLLPNRESIYLQLVTCESLFKQKAQPWGGNFSELNLSTLSEECLSSWYREPLKEEYKVGNSHQCFCIDYSKIERNSFEQVIELEISETATIHGFFLFTKVEFPSGEIYSCETPDEICVSGSAFFPFPEPLFLSSGDELRIRVSAHPINGDYVWSWNTSWSRKASVQKSFEQSTLKQFIQPGIFEKKQNSSYVPFSSRRTELAGRTLALIDGHRSIKEVAEIVFSEFSDQLADRNKAIAFVRKVAAEFSN